MHGGHQCASFHNDTRVSDNLLDDSSVLVEKFASMCPIRSEIIAFPKQLSNFRRFIDTRVADSLLDDASAS